MSKSLIIIFTIAGLFLLAAMALTAVGIWTGDERWFLTAQLCGFPGLGIATFGPLISLGIGD